MSAFNNEDRARQLVEFDLFQSKNNKIGLSDIDFAFEIKGKWLIIGDVKLHDKSIPLGQKLLLTRIAQHWEAVPGCKAAVIRAQHEVTDDKENVKLSETIVTDIFFNNARGWHWEKPNKTFENTLKLLDGFWNTGGELVFEPTTSGKLDPFGNSWMSPDEIQKNNKAKEESLEEWDF